MKKTTKAIVKAIASIHMPKADVLKYGAAATQIEHALGVKRGEQYMHVGRALIAHLGSGRDNAAKAEWDYRRDTFAIGCGFGTKGTLTSEGRANFNKSAQYKGLMSALKEIGFNVPTAELDESTKAERERAKATKQRAVNRIKADLKKVQPSLAKDAELLQAKAEELYADKKASATESGKQAKERAKVVVWLEALAKRAKAQELGDADPKPCMERIAALIISVNELA